MNKIKQSVLNDNFPQSIIETMELIDSTYPKVIFGGSIALTCVGLINRPIGDIDIVLSKETGMPRDLLRLSEKDSSPNIEFSESTTNEDGTLNKRVGLIINGVKVCCFFADEDELDHSFTMIRGRIFKINGVNNAIKAKLNYVKKGCKSKEKHVKDLQDIDFMLTFAC